MSSCLGDTVAVATGDPVRASGVSGMIEEILSV